MARSDTDTWHDYYEILGLDDESLGPKSTPNQIEKAWKSQKVIWHPDSFIGRSQEDQRNAAEKFKLVYKAYEVLSDPRQKEGYDRQWHSFRSSREESKEPPRRKEESVLQPEIIMEWEPAEAANPDYFYDLTPGETKQAGLWVRPRFPGIAPFKVRISGTLPHWLKVTPTSFHPPIMLSIEVDATNIDAQPGADWVSGFDLGFVLDE